MFPRRFPAVLPSPVHSITRFVAYVRYAVHTPARYNAKIAKIALLLAPSARPLSRNQVIVGKYTSHAIPSHTGPGGGWRRSVWYLAQVSVVSGAGPFLG